MPGYKSKTQSKKNLKSSNKAKNGGRRRKQTMKKVRRGRKVMRGGSTPYVASLSNKSDKLYNILLQDETIIDKGKLEDLIYNSAVYNDSIVKGWYNDLFGTYPPLELKMDDVKEAIVQKLENKV